jgi:SAM-dependent methyltransferase
VDERVRWLDLCCGTGRGLVQAADRLARAGLDGRVAIVGVDLVDFFDASPHPSELLRLTCASVTSWTPRHRFDLITCVHGLHYVGDKLGLLTRVAGWLTADGLFSAHLDLDNIRLDDGRPGGRRLVASLRAAGFTVDLRRRRIGRTGPGTQIESADPGTRIGGTGRANRIRGAGRASRTGDSDLGTPTLPYTYLGADDRAGPNSTGQPAVNSHYAERPPD